jgi:hypothetical protein
MRKDHSTIALARHAERTSSGLGTPVPRGIPQTAHLIDALGQSAFMKVSFCQVCRFSLCMPWKPHSTIELARHAERTHYDLGTPVPRGILRIAHLIDALGQSAFTK